MDTSPIYVEMCRKAKEIQTAIVEDVKGSWYCIPTTRDWDNYAIYISQGDHFAVHDRIEPIVWLPRQDQLLALIPLYPIHIPVLEGWATGQYLLEPEGYPEYNCPMFIFDTYEQFCLAFFMWDKHMKKWDGSEWVGRVFFADKPSPTA